MEQNHAGLQGKWIRFLLIFLVVGVVVMQLFEQPAPGAGVSPGQREFWLSQFADGSSGDLSFASDIVLLNASATTSFSSVFSHSGETGLPTPLLKDPSGNATDSLTIQIPGNGSRRLGSAIPSGSTGFRSGWLGFFSQNGKVFPQVEFTIRIVVQSGQGTASAPAGSAPAVVAKAQVPGRDLVSEGSFLAAVQGRTGFAILNPLFSPSDAQVTMGTIGEDGDILEIEQFSLFPGQRLSMFLDEVFDLNETPASVEFRSTIPLSVLPLVQDGLVLTNQDVFPARRSLN